MKMKWGKIVLQRGHILAGAAFVMLPLAVFASKAMTPLAIGTAVLLLGREVWASRCFPPLLPLGGIVGILAGGVAWGALSVAWTVDMGNTVGKTGQLLGLFSAGLVLTDAAQRLEPKEKTWVKRALLAGFLLGCLVLAYESLTGGLLSRWVRGLPAEAGLLFKAPATVAALMVFPVVAALAGRWAWGVHGASSRSAAPNPRHNGRCGRGNRRGGPVGGACAFPGDGARGRRLDRDQCGRGARRAVRAVLVSAQANLSDTPAVYVAAPLADLAVHGGADCRKAGSGLGA